VWSFYVSYGHVLAYHVIHRAVTGWAKGHGQYAKIAQYTTLIIGKVTGTYRALVLITLVFKALDHD
jgi:hypothetical protein